MLCLRNNAQINKELQTTLSQPLSGEVCGRDSVASDPVNSALVERMSWRGLSLHVQGLGQVAQDPVGMAMPQAVPCPGEPPARLGGASIEPGGRTLPEVLRCVVKVQDARGRGRKTLIKQAPQPPAAITEPDHLGRVPDALAQRFEPETRLEGIDIPKTAPSRRCVSRVTTWPVRVRCWLIRASTPTLTSRQRILPRGAPASGRNGTITPLAPRANGKAATSAVRARALVRARGLCSNGAKTWDVSLESL